LLSPRAKATSVGFLLGWLVGIIVAIVLFTLLSPVLPQRDDSDSSPVTAVIKIILGALLLLLAAKQWRGRPAEGEQAAMPKWMSAVDSLAG
jgi:Na+/melibiose symporter-like transporter